MYEPKAARRVKRALFKKEKIPEEGTGVQNKYLRWDVVDGPTASQRSPKDNICLDSPS